MQFDMHIDLESLLQVLLDGSHKNQHNIIYIHIFCKLQLKFCKVFFRVFLLLYLFFKFEHVGY